ncbi:MAG: hypothetical protein HY760_00370, partial [Nitrospirae bacterium]|nr:hypothetical protein [Nitrospirota bacterium]
GFKVDIATARTEFYEYPTALPTVEHASIKKDLYRRDCTINTLAVRLNKKEFGALIDHFGGQRDIKEKTIRVLHNLSFVEDPTRVYRAIRFEQRFGFRIAKHTQTLIKSAVTMDLFHRLSGQRVYDEMVQLLSEEAPVKALRRLAEFDLLRFIHPSLTLDDRGIARFDRIRETLSWYDLSFLQGRPETWVLYLMGFLDGLYAGALQEVFDRLAVPEKLRPILQMTKKAVPQILDELSQELKPSRIHALLHPLPVEVLLFMMAKAGKDRAKRQISLYLTRLREVRIALTGKDLEQMGIPRGPLYAKLLQGLLEGRLNGEILSREDEMNFIAPHVQKSGRGPKPAGEQRGQKPPRDPQRDAMKSSKETGGRRPPEEERKKETALERPEIGSPVREPREKKPEETPGEPESSVKPMEQKTSEGPTEQKPGSGRRRRRNRGRRRRGQGKPGTEGTSSGTPPG